MALTPAICHLMPKSYAISVLWILACLAPAFELFAQPTPEGSDVVNLATATYMDAGSLDASASNAVSTLVATLHALRFAPPGSVAAPAFVLSGTPGDTLYCRLTLENLGNAPDSVLTAAAMLVPSTLTPAVIFFLDANGNARFEAGEDDPSFLALASGGFTPVDVAIVLPPIGGGMAHVELRATSSVDPAPKAQLKSHAQPATDATVVRVTSLATNVSLYLGPVGNPRALPGGEASSDDATQAAIGLYDETVSFASEIENAGDADSLEVFVAAASALPSGVSFACTDANGVAYPVSPRPGRFALGWFAPGESRPLRFVLTSPGNPLRVALGGQSTIDFTAQSRVDTLVSNSTRFDLGLTQPPDARTMLGLEQTFRQSRGVLGDIVTLIVTATNRTDSVRVDQVVVREAASAALDFLGGEGASFVNGHVEWSAGSLAPGESRSTAIKFAVNSRESKGWARIAGTASGAAQTGSMAQTGPIVAAIRIDNEEFGIEGFLLGDVWIDVNENQKRDLGEPGARNVSVYLDSGEYAVTDSLGVFSIPHVFEGWRVVRLDEGTLPQGAELVRSPVNDQYAWRPNERLVRLIAPAHARVAFPLRATPKPTMSRTAALVLNERLDLVKAPRKQADFTLPSWQFGLGKAQLRLQARPELIPLAHFLMDNPDYTVLIEGHTDDIPVRLGPFRSNLELSVARATSVRDALIAMGVSSDRFVVRGYGDERPIASNQTEEGRARNRRVDINLISPHDLSDDLPAGLAARFSGSADRPDSLRTTLRWSLASSAELPQRATLRVEVPSALADARLSVIRGRQNIEAQDGAFLVEPFTREERLECELAFTVAETDTQRIRDIRAHLHLQEIGAAGDSLAHSVVLSPSAARSSAREAQLLDWTETLPLAAPQPAPELAVTASDSVASASAGPIEIEAPSDGSVVSNRDQITVRVRHPLGSHVSLLIADDEIGPDRLGLRTVDVARQEETSTWYGVRLRGGWNDLVVRAALLQGGEAADSVRVALATRPAEIVPLDARTLIPADGRSDATLRFSVRDGFGLPVMDGFEVELSEGEALALDPDARPERRGLQLRTSEGIVTVPIRPSHTTGAGRIVVEAEGMRAETEILYVNSERPLLATGVIGAGVGIYRKQGEGSSQGIEHHTDGLDGEAEARAFVQGAVPGGFRMTARLDTRKRYDDPLLKQPDPEQQYPIYGDASALHYAAPARGGNYVSFDRGQSYLRYSDFTTPIDKGEFLTYHQVATGLSGAAIDGATGFRAFISESDFLTRTDNLPADGTSGFYYLSQAPIVENSERVIVETRDRYQSEKVLEARVMMRRRDYTINPYDGSILFFEPIAVTDRELNPNVIVVTYETEKKESGMYLLGARSDLARGNRHRAGVTAVANVGDAPGYTLFGADGETRLGALRLGGEVAHSDDPIAGGANAYKLSAGAQRGLSKLDLYVRRVDGDFSNPSFRSADSELASLKAGFEGRLAANSNFAWIADGYTHELSRTGERRATLRSAAEYRRKLLEFSAGVRLAEHDQPQEDRSSALSLLGFALGSRSGTGLATVWEQNLGDQVVEDYPNRVRTTLGVPITGRFRAVATHEIQSSSGRASTQQVAAGIEGTNSRGMQAYLRYSMDRAASDERMGAVSGVRQRLALDDRTSATLGVESFHSLSRRRDEEYTAITSGLASRQSGHYFIDGGYEFRWERPGDKHLLRISAAQQLEGGVAWLVKNILGLNARNDRSDGTQWYATLAGTHRVPHLPVQSLLMVKSLYDRHAPLDPEAISWRLVVSADVNYLANPEHELRLKLAYKHAEDESYGSWYSTDTDVLLAQHIWRFGRGWDLDTWGRGVGLRHGQTSQTGAGIELGRVVFRSVRVGLGYSVNGFDDPDISGTDAWSDGFGLRIQMVLSEWLLSDFAGLK